MRSLSRLRAGLLLAPFAAGLLAEDLLELAPEPLRAFVVLALGVRLALARGRRRAAAALAAEMALGGALGALALSLRLHGPAPRAGGARVVQIAGAPERVVHGCRAPVEVLGERGGRALLAIPPERCAALPGERYLARLRLEPLRPRTNPGGSSAERRWARRGVHRAGSVEHGWMERLGGTSAGPAAWVERARRRVGDALDPPDRPTPPGALLRALVIGARDRLAPETERAFERSGTAHLLSISGLHVSWAFAMTQFGVGWLLRALPGTALARRAPAIAQAIGLAAGAGSALLAGLGPPALRAAAMAGAGTAAALGGRPAAVWNGLLAAAFAALLVEPASMFEGALWLSFVAVAGILLWRPAGGAAARAVGCTLGAGLATAPLAVGLGLPVPAGSLVANAVAIPWFGVVVMPLAFALVAADALAPPLVPALRPLALGAAALGTRAMDALASADLLAHLPHPRALALGGAGGLLALRLLWLGAPLPALTLALAATLASVPLAVRAPGPDAEEELLFLDVGHGDAVLVRSGAHAWLVDAGPRAGRFDAGRSVVVPALRAEGIERLERMLVTHADADHIGGAAAVLAAHPVDEVWIGRGTYESPAALPLRRAAARRGVPLRIVAAGARARVGSLRAELLWPPAGAPPEASNPGSLVLRIRGVGGCAVLGGDAPASVERALAPGLGRCALLKLGHHGSRTSTDPAWLAALAPQVAVASAGRRSSGSLPHPAVRARLRAAAVSVWETRRFGALRVRLAEGGPLVLPYLSAPLDDGG